MSIVITDEKIGDYLKRCNCSSLKEICGEYRIPNYRSGLRKNELVDAIRTFYIV